MSCGPGTFPMSFDTANPEAIAWAERNAARLVADVTADARAAIKELVVRGFEAGVSPEQTARLIRNTVGLTQRDAVAVMNRQLKLMESGLSATSASAKAEKYADKLLRSRARTIARTETMRASNEGTAQLWKQAQERGILSLTMRKVWQTNDPCPICAPMSGERVKITEDFSIGFDPPAHPNCRCTIGMVN